MAIQFKTCKMCEVSLDLTKFRSRADGTFRNFCKPCECIKQKQYLLNNSEKAKQSKKNWYINNKKRAFSAHYKYVKTRLKSDVSFRLLTNIRSRFYMAIKFGWKTGTTIGNLGCSIDVYKKYLESKFQPGMDWNNYSVIGWHIDHIIPLTAFDLSNPEETKKACHYLNTQPLWAIDNIKKSNRAA